MNAKNLLAALPLVLLLAACGNKGPLVMPQKPVPVEEPAPAEPVEEPAADPAADPAVQPPPAANPDPPVGGSDG